MLLAVKLITPVALYKQRQNNKKKRLRKTTGGRIKSYDELVSDGPATFALRTTATRQTNKRCSNRASNKETPPTYATAGMIGFEPTTTAGAAAAATVDDDGGTTTAGGAAAAETATAGAADADAGETDDDDADDDDDATDAAGDTVGGTLGAAGAAAFDCAMI